MKNSKLQEVAQFSFFDHCIERIEKNTGKVRESCFGEKWAVTYSFVSISNSLLCAVKFRLPPSNEIAQRYCFRSCVSGILFTRMGSHVITTHDAIIQSQVTWEPPPLPSPLDILKHVYLGTSTFPDMFRLVHYEVPDICWQAGGWHSTEMPSCCFYLQKYEML